MSDKNKFLNFINEEVNRVHKLSLLEEKKVSLEKELKEIFNWNQKSEEGEGHKTESLIKKAVEEIYGLNEEDVVLFSKSTTDLPTSIQTALNAIENRMPAFSELMREKLFKAEVQDGVKIVNPYETNSDRDERFPLIVPGRFRPITKAIANGLLTVDLDSLKKGLGELLNLEY